MIDDSLEVWESEGGGPRPRRSKAFFQSAIKHHFAGEVVYSEMDGGVFWRSITKPEKGDVIEYKGKAWKVLYSWKWTTYLGVPIYFAELDPA